MEEGIPYHLLFSDVLISLLSFSFFIMDIVLDTCAVVSLYQEREYVYMGVLLFLLIISSVLQQIFSWLWYTDSTKSSDTTLEKCIKDHRLLGVIHILQLGTFLRFADVLLISIKSYKQTDPFKKGVTVFKIHDLSMLRLFEAFTENAPQAALMVINIIREHELQLIPGLKLISSLTGLAITMLSYHRNMRSFLEDKNKMGWLSSVVYFLWNFLLISSRLICIALFASVLPCYIVAHFLSIWTLLVFWAWRQKTDFMDNKAGEWLYRATVGIIWYFSWFNVAGGHTKVKGIFYHTVTALDMTLLLGLWWWERSVQSAHLGPLPINPYLLIAITALVYIVGLSLKSAYYWKCHPNHQSVKINKPDSKPKTYPQKSLRTVACSVAIETDSINTNPEPELETEPEPAASGIHKRMRNMAGSFF